MHDRENFLGGISPDSFFTEKELQEIQEIQSWILINPQEAAEYILYLETKIEDEKL